MVYKLRSHMDCLYVLGCLLSLSEFLHVHSQPAAAAAA